MLIVKYNIGFKTLLQQGISESMFYGDLVYKFKRIVGKPYFKNIFDFTTAGDRDCVVALERLPTLHFCVDFIFLSFGIMGFIVEL